MYISLQPGGVVPTISNIIHTYRFFVQVPNLEKKPTFKKFIALLDNYIGQIDKPDRASGSELAEQQTLINSILGTQVWHRARTFLVNGGESY